ncbi:MAG: hypothetical protein GX357_01195 [Firmicutes bacterium]|nr:hypothetical protein [Bacillota bacterium]
MSEDIFISDDLEPTEAELVFKSTTSKKFLSGVRGRASRTGRKGPVMTPVDFLTGKAKKEYMQNSEVIVYNMYENRVLPYEEFKELPIEKQVVLMTKWREEIATNDIIRDMKISRKKFYSEVLKSLGIETKPRGRRPKKTETNGETQTDMQLAPQVNKQVVPAETKVEPAFAVIFSGEFEGQVAAIRLARLARILDNDGKYEIKFEIKEISRA